MKCEKCGHTTIFMVQAIITAPSEFFHKLSKQNLRNKDVMLQGVNWETADIICQNPQCNHVLAGYGNYVTKLENEVKRLKALYEKDDTD